MHGASTTAIANSLRHTQTMRRRTISSTPPSTSSCSTSSASSDRAGSPPVMPNSPAPPLTQHASGRTPDVLHANPTRKERTMDKLCFTAEEVADRLSVSKTRVYDLMRCGELPSVKLGRSRLIKAADLLAYVENLEPAPVVA
ncbi:hypothetical protein DS079_11355 [Brachybacterium paraconglomeratum]|uniref:Helix-turn-helix domain-containing protein n=1 Tax=Brachybacterium paraconglomeratum TaxID=173362 RepID=A0A426SJI2_9MICO|nr:hypothetical protein DS079_11355 [Brachybacterium paraconglomeratum]